MIIWITILQQCAHFPPTKQDGNLTQLRGKEKEKKNSEISAYLDWTAMMLNRVSFGLHNLVRLYIHKLRSDNFQSEYVVRMRCIDNKKHLCFIAQLSFHDQEDP